MEKLLIVIGFSGIAIGVLCWLIKEIDSRLKPKSKKE